MRILLIDAKPSASKKKFGEGCQSRTIASVSNLPDGIGLVRVYLPILKTIFLVLQEDQVLYH